MLQDIRSNFLKGPLAKGIAVVIALSFALFGIQSILVGGSDDTIATVDDEKISENTLRETVNNRMRRLAAMLGQEFDPTELDQERIKAEALSFLISDQILSNLISELEMTVAESELGKEISLMEPFKEGGRFSPDLYRAVITNAGYTPASFKAEAKADILKRHLYTGIIGSDFITPLELELEGRVSTEKRDVRYVKIPLSHFDKNAVVNKSEIEDFYLKNQSFFSTEEEVSVEYIEIKSEHFIKPVEQQSLINEYELVKQDYEQPQENRISHVLLIKKTDESEQEYEQRINLVENKLSGGLELGEAARQFSDDTGSAQSGGDLGFSSGDAFPEEMEIAASKLAVGEVSDRVKTDAGIHFLLLTDRKEQSQASFEGLQEQLTRKIQERAADALLLSLVEELRDVAFNSVDLNKVAEISNRQIDISDLFSRSGVDEGIFAETKIINAAFSEEVIQDGYNSEVIELSPKHFVVLRKSRYLPSKLKPIEEVKPEIIQQIKENKIKHIALEETARLGDAIINGETTIEEIALKEGYEWQVEIGGTRTKNELPRELSEKVFSLPITSALPVTNQSLGGSEFIFLYELVRVQPGGMDKFSAQELPQIKKQLSRIWGDAVFNELQKARRDASEIEVF